MKPFDLHGLKTYELASYDRNDLYFNMQELEYWEDKPQYPGLPEEEPKPLLPGGVE